jgi:hypothetical protein
MADQNRSTRPEDMEKAEGDREDAPESQYEKGGGAGITNRSLGEEIENQKEVPARGGSKPGAHAG